MNNQFEKLDVWKKSHFFVLSIYKTTSRFPNQERYSLTDQLRRAAVSIAANIVEGNIRYSKNEFLQFMYISKSSLEETKYHLLLAKDLQYISGEMYAELQIQAVEVGKLIGGFIKYLKLKPNIKYDIQVNRKS